mgnify:CR=1 FL=1
MMKRIIKNFCTIAALVLVLIATSGYVINFVHYGWFCFKTVSIEREGERVRYSKNSNEQADIKFVETNGWSEDPSLKEEYNSVIAQKKAFIERSDVARWIADCAETQTGEIMRWVSFAMSILVFGCSFIILIRVLLDDMRFLIKKFRM